MAAQAEVDAAIARLKDLKLAAQAKQEVGLAVRDVRSARTRMCSAGKLGSDAVPRGATSALAGLL